MMVDNELKERVRNAVDIVEVIGERIPLRKAGKNYVALCPFHKEKTPSFNVNPERQIYHCFGCGAGGDVFSFLMAYDKISFPEALRTLAERAGIPLAERRGVRRQAQQDALDAYYEANALAREFFVKMLGDPQKGAPAREYLRSRGLTEETIRRFGIGYAPDGWDNLLKLARTRGISAEVLEAAGLAVKGERGSFYDRFRGRITFPIVNQSGRVVAFGARTLDPEGQPKYLNSPETPIYQKSRVLYGLFHAREAIRQEGWVMVVEGYMDVLQLMQAGMENVVATCGTALTREHGELLHRYAERIVLVFDGDDAGVRAALRAGDVLVEAGIEPVVALLPEGEDPDTLVAVEGPDVLRQMAERATPYLRFKWEHLAREHDMRTIAGRNRAIGEMLDVIAPVEDELTRTLMAGQVAEWSSVDDTLIARAIARRRRRRRPMQSTAPETTERWKPPQPEKELVAWMLDRPWVCQMVGEMGIECFTDPLLREIASTLVRLNDEGEAPTAAKLLDEKPDNAAWTGAIAALSQMGHDEREIERAVTELIASLQLPHLTRQIDMVRAQLREPMEAAKRRELVTELQRLLRERERLTAVRLRQSDG